MLFRAIVESPVRTRVRRNRKFMNMNKLCGSRHNMPRPSPPSVSAEAPRAAEPADRNVAVGSHAQYVPTVTVAAA